MSEREIGVPVLRNDGETLSERLTSNAYQDILPARYLKKDENGEVIEEQEKLFERVAKNIAVAEAVHSDEPLKHVDVDCIHEHFDNGDVEGYDFDFGTIPLTEETARYFSYDGLMNQFRGKQEYEDTVRRMEKWEGKFQEAMEHLKLMPNSPTLMNAGDELQQLAACFTLHPEDDMEEIYNEVTKGALTMQSGGGIGLNFVELRPYGDVVGSSGGISSGPISFMRSFDQMCSTIRQGGTRRGAMMGMLNINHPDIPLFLHAKNKDVSLAQTLLLNDPDDHTNNSFAEALEEARELIEDNKVPEHLRNAAEGHLSNFNISAVVDDEFMECLENNKDYTMINPRTDEPHIATEHTKELYSWFGLGDCVEVGKELSIPASELWDHVISGAWENGEPGVFFVDTANKEHAFDVEKHPEREIRETNPCFVGDTHVYTEDGIRTFEELYQSQSDVLVDSEFCEDNDGNTLRVVENGEKDVYKVDTEEGYEFKCTENHEIRTFDGEWVSVSELNSGEKISIFNGLGAFGDNGSIEEGRLMGWFSGDGHYSEYNEKAIFDFYDEKTELVDNFENYARKVSPEAKIDREYNISATEIDQKAPHRDGGEKYNISSQRLYRHFKKYLGEEKTHVSDYIFQGSEEMVRGYLQGIFTADGSIQSYSGQRNSIRLTSVEEKHLKDVQKLLLQFGIKSVIYNERKGEGMKEMPDGKGGYKEYECQELHELCVTKDGMETFCEEIGFLLDDKQEKLEETLAGYTKGPYSQKFYATIEKIEYSGVETVYDLTETKTHSYIANGVVAHNCGEIAMETYDACNLAHINLSTIVDSNSHRWSRFTKNGPSAIDRNVEKFLDQAIDWEELNERVEIGTRFLDNVVTMSDYPVDEIDDTVASMRRIGLGVMGLAQLFVQLGVEYGSPEADEIARQVMKHINHKSKEESRNLSQERGVFSLWDDSKFANPTQYPEWFEKHVGEKAEDWESGFRLRNMNTTMIAPCGTTGMVANTTGGCEPIYNVAFYKNVSEDIQGDEMLVEFDNLFLETLKENNIDIDTVKEEAEELMENNNYDSPSDIPSVPEALGNLFVTAGELDAEEHASVQCALQEGVDSSISKTTNASFDSTVQDAKDVFEYIYENGGKAVTFYRDGSRTKQVKTTRKDNQEVDGGDGSEGVSEALPRERPKVTSGTTHRVSTGYGNLYVTINEDEHGPVELFATVGKSGGTMESFSEALARQVSLSLRAGIPVDEIVDQLGGIRSPNTGWDNQETIHSIPDAIATALKRTYTDSDEEEDEDMMNHPTTNVEVEQNGNSATSDEPCPDCGGMSVYLSEGCKTCEACGWSEC